MTRRRTSKQADYLERFGVEKYLDLVLFQTVSRKDRTGPEQSTLRVQMRFNLQEGFPLTTKKLHVKSIIYELLWFLR